MYSRVFLRESAKGAEKEDNFFFKVYYKAERAILIFKIALSLCLVLNFKLVPQGLFSNFKALDVVRQSFFKVNSVAAALLIKHSEPDTFKRKINGTFES